MLGSNAVGLPSIELGQPWWMPKKGRFSKSGLLNEV